MKSPLKRLSYVLAFIADSPSAPKSAHKEQKDNLLSYYQSSIPNEVQSHARSASTPQGFLPSTRPVVPARKMSSTSMSSESDYSYDSDRDCPYDSETNDTKHSLSESSSSVTRRSGAPSRGGADRRRMAIVQMDGTADRAYKSSSETASSASIRSRRGHTSSLTGLALVAPPDAALRTYTQLTPPSTAPVSGDYMNHVLLTATQGKVHSRSSSQDPSSKKTATSRDTSSTQGTQSLLSSANNSKIPRETKNADHNNKAFPNHRTSSSRSPSPDMSTAIDDRDLHHGLLSPPTTAYPSARTIDMFSPIVTPDIGEGKEIHMPVAGPVVVKLDGVQSRRVESTPSWRNEQSPASQAHSQSSAYGSPAAHSSTSAYLYYEPGVHSTAGPLPPPPRTSINLNISTPPPPRPPRLHSPAPARMKSDLEAVKQALQLPPSVTAALAARSPSKLSLSHSEEKKKTVSEQKDNAGGESIVSRPSIHRREGATLATSSVDASSTESSPSLPNQPSPKPPSPGLPVVQEVDKPSSPPENPTDDVPDVTVEAAAPTNTPPSEKIDTAKFNQWLKENPHLAKGLAQEDAHSRESMERSLSPLSADITGDAPSPPPKSFRNSLTNNLKRFSALPRSPSLSSRSRPSSGSTRYSRTPSPSLHHAPPPPPPNRASFQKIHSTNPAALFCHEVNSQHTTIQRCAIYVAKINELYVHDCGLSEWVFETKSRGSTNPHGMQRGPSSQPFVPQPRQTSRSSMISEATFPIRPDASVATDLMQGAYRDITPPGIPPPSLPYPSLAVNPPRSTQPSRSNSSATSGTPPSSVRSLVSSPSTKGAGFFASLGRKASLSSRKERFPTHLSSTSGTISSNSGRSISKNPASTTNISRPVLISNPPSVPGGPRAPPRRAQRSQTFTSSALLNSERDDSMGRRPSLFNLTLDTVIDIQPDPAFTRQVDQLAALLPHADRDVLAGYLRRAGQDMLAIGQYLEDERMGTIRQPF
ncbi:hypothetical protein JR316_0004520 [Psilocybe cubensis]|uniref:Uncharacterized protein n=2 Tax=Psilocybe cubensis TaxID=181762 RepID=A0A8H8CJQ5_PSICU|nr:hypothetical protein JR316_0004520 [Psilocybe cubensis]KAH9482420.1 hypothetical protein JR316_0004520 [Psilocybe cubensis]